MSRTKGILRQQRESLFQKCINVASLQDLLSVQEKIVEGIRTTEREIIANGRTDALTFHISRLRLYADGIVWFVLHPHTIRQMAKNPRPVPSIEGQGAIFDHTIESAKRNLRKYKAPVLICDITNILRIGDMLVCIDPEVPLIIECKSKLPKPEYIMQGRRGRQISHFTSIMRYLHEGFSKVFGGTLHYYAVDSTHKTRRNWDILAEVCQKACETGVSHKDISEYEILCAYTPDHRDSIGSKFVRLRSIASGRGEHKDQVVYFGTSSGLMNMTDGLFPPPSAWPIPAEMRFAVLEGDIEIAHIVDGRAFERKSLQSQDIKMMHNEDFPIHVTINGVVYPLSLHFVYDVLYGFETVDSCVKGLIAFARKLQSIELPDIQDNEEEKPTIRHVENLEEAKSLLNSGVDDKFSLVSMSVSLMELIQQDRRPTACRNSISSDVHYANKAYAILDLQTFRELISNYVDGQ